MNDDGIAYTVGKAHGMRGQGNRAHIFLPTTSSGYNRYNKGYADGVAQTQKDIDDQRNRHSRLATTTSTAPVQRATKNLHQAALDG